MQISLIFVDTFVKKGLVFLFSHKLNKLRYYSHTHKKNAGQTRAIRRPVRRTVLYGFLTGFVCGQVDQDKNKIHIIRISHQRCLFSNFICKNSETTLISVRHF